MRYGSRSSRLSPNDAACSSRAPSVASEHPRPGRRLRAEPKDRDKVVGAGQHRRCPDGSTPAHSSALTEAEEAIVVEFRRRTLLPLDVILGCLRDTIPRLTRSALHRCLVRHGIARLPQDEEKVSKRKRFAETAMGYVHIDVCELRLA